MATYVALLRSVNVGGRKLAMADLRTLFDTLGHREVRTYIQSGNVVFGAKAGKPAAVRGAIERAIASELGLEVTVLLRTAHDLGKVLAANPFGPGAYVTFLDERPAPAAVKALDPRQYAPDEFAIVGREAYVHAPHGYGRTKINNTYFERKLATRATTRNLRTVATLYDWASE